MPRNPGITAIQLVANLLCQESGDYHSHPTGV